MMTNRIATRWMLIMLGAICFGALADCQAAPQVQTDWRYDGRSPQAFQQFVQRTGHSDWPVPKRLSYMEINGDKQAIRYAHWVPSHPQNVAGTVIFFSGRTEFIEKNIYTYKALLERHYEVWTLDWRGQGLSARQIANKQKGHIDSFDTFLADTEAFLDNVVRLDQKPGKKILLAHSMGGQIAMRYLLTHPNAFDYAVMSSPMLAIPGINPFILAGNWLKRHLLLENTCTLTKKADWSSPFTGMDACKLAYASETQTLNQHTPQSSRIYSYDAQKLAEIDCWIRASINHNPAQPDLRVACPTSQWLGAALQSIDIVQARADQLQTPTLIIRAPDDQIIDPDGQTLFCSEQHKSCCLVSFEPDTVGHELLIEQQQSRRLFLQRFDRFVNDHALQAVARCKASDRTLQISGQ